MEKLIDNLPLVARRDFSALKNICGVSLDDLHDMIAELRQLNPKPGHVFGAEPVVPVVPGSRRRRRGRRGARSARRSWSRARRPGRRRARRPRPPRGHGGVLRPALPAHPAVPVPAHRGALGRQLANGIEGACQAAYRWASGAAEAPWATTLRATALRILRVVMIPRSLLGHCVELFGMGRTTRAQIFRVMRTSV